MTTLTEQLNLIASQIKDIESAKRATEKSMYLTKKEAAALSDARESMKALSTYSLLKPSMDTAEANLADKLTKLKEFENIAENAIDKFYDMLTEFSDLHAGVLKKVNEFEIIPTSHNVEVEPVAPKPSEVVPTENSVEIEPVMAPEIPDPIISEKLDEIAPKPVKGRSGLDGLDGLDGLELSLNLNTNPTEVEPERKPKGGTESLGNFDELDAKLSGAHFK